MKLEDPECEICGRKMGLDKEATASKADINKCKKCYNQYHKGGSSNLDEDTTKSEKDKNVKKTQLEGKT